ncbi:MAG: hypothetical protein KAH32_05560 [Chlamydiia bacterium]|nr:hypothetical protein [Chlamydiia bacterium]
MACKDFFNSLGADARVVREEKHNNISAVFNSRGEPSVLWDKILGLRNNIFSESNIAPEYIKYLDTLQANNLINDWRKNPIEARFGLMSVFYTDTFKKKYGDFETGDYIGETINNEPVVRDGGKILVGQHLLFLNTPTIINRTKKANRGSLKRGKLTWVMPGVDTSSTASALSGLVDQDKFGSVVNIDNELAKSLGVTVEELFKSFENLTDDEVYMQYTPLLESLEEHSLTYITSSMALMPKASSIFYNDSFSKMDAATRLSLRRGLSANEDAFLYLVAEGVTFEDALQNKNEKGKEEFSAIRALDEMLLVNPKLVSSVIDHLVGKQHGADVKSQLLSAATDNAKVLILAKIRANDFTNGIITAMLIMGYDLHDIIDFLYDPSIEATLVAFNKKLETGEPASLNWGSIEKTPELDAIRNNPSMRSLKSILDVSDDIMAFGSVRSLSENFKIESFAMDKIFDTIRTDLLFEAIQNNDLDSLFVEGKIFNPEVFIFLHPHSRLVFKSLYSTEKYIMPTLFKTAPIVRNFLDTGDRNIDSYRSAKRYINEMMIESFFNETNNDGNYKTAVDSYNDVNYPMNNHRNREEFLRKFPDMVQNTRDLLKREGVVNIALEAFTFKTKFESDLPILDIGSYSSSETDAIVKGSIASAIKDLNTTHINANVDRVQSEIYSNLALYLLMTGGGSVSASNIFELFSDINHEFSAHVGTLGDEFFYSIGMSAKPEKNSVEENVLKPLMLDKLPELNDLNAMQSDFGDFQEESMDDQVNIDQYSEYQDDMDTDMSMMDESSMSNSKVSPNITGAMYPIKYSINTVGKVFKFSGSVFTKNAQYIGVDNSRPFQVFNASIRESLPNSSNATEVSFQNMDPEVMRTLGNLGYQVGFDARYKGHDIRILSYSGKDIKTGQTLYTIYDMQTGVFKVVSSFNLLKDNVGIALFGNLIGPLSGRNEFLMSPIRAAMKITTDQVEDRIADVIGLDQVAIDGQLKRVFENIPNIFDNLHLEKELKLANMASSILTADKKFTTGNAIYNGFRNSEYKKFDTSSKSFFIPLLRGAGNIENTVKFKSSIADNLVAVINSKEIGETTEFLFIFDSDVAYNVDNAAESFVQAFSKLGNVRIEREKLKDLDGVDTGAYKINVTKTSDAKILQFNGEAMTVHVDTVVGNLTVYSSKGKSANSQTKLAAIYAGLDEGVYNGKIAKTGGKEYLYVAPDVKNSYIYEVVTTDGNIAFEYIDDKTTLDTLRPAIEKRIKDEDIPTCGL